MEKEKPVYIGIYRDIYNSLCEYCELNKIKKTDFVNEAIRKELLMSKYGDAPFLNTEIDLASGEDKTTVFVYDKNKNEVIEEFDYKPFKEGDEKIAKQITEKLIEHYKQEDSENLVKLLENPIQPKNNKRKLK